MKTILAYALIVVGVPCLIGMWVGSIVVIPVSRLLLKSLEIRPTHLLFLEFFNGLVASALGAIIFLIFGLTPGLAIPIIIVAWVTFYFVTYHQPFQSWVGCLAGIVVGWFTLV